MELTPETYRCEDHDADLTELVREQLEDRVPATMRPAGEQFRVIVTCRGPAPHDVGVTGAVRYAR